MKVSIFVAATRPLERGDNYKEAMSCYNDLADEVIEEGADWPQEFTWPLIGETFQKAYERTTGDWSIHCDLDYIFHERDFGRIRQALRDYPHSPAVSFYKWQFIQPDRYNLKSRLLLAVNNKFRDKIKFDSGGDLCQPSFNGDQLLLEDMPQAGVPFYNYEKLSKTLPQIMDDVGRMDRAYYKHFKKYLYGLGDDVSAYEGWLEMMTGRYARPSEKIPLGAHPKYIRETIHNLQPNQWGYSGFGNFGRNYA